MTNLDAPQHETRAADGRYVLTTGTLVAAALAVPLALAGVGLPSRSRP